MSIEKFDREAGYCRMLGHRIPFTYCRTSKEGLPCRSIKNCWFEKIDIAAFIEENYSAEEQETIFVSPRDKVSSLLSLIEEAKSRAKQ